MLTVVAIVASLALSGAIEFGQASSVSPASLDWAARLPPRQPIAGLPGFESISVVRYASAPDEEHELACSYVFPARARWQITVRGRPELGRHIEYRCGDAYFEFAQSAERSAQVDASQRAAKCELLELRRAAFLWPDGFEWKGEGDSRRAVTDCGRTLVALLGTEGRPASLAFESSSAGAAESLHIRTWLKRHERWWPETLEFRQGMERVWDERVETVTSRLALLDTYFVPPDRRESSTAHGAARVLHLDAPAQHEFRRALAPNTDWASAARAWLEFRAQVATELPSGWSCLPGAAFELDDQCAPTVAILRLSGAGDPPRDAKTWPPEPALTTTARWPLPDLSVARDRLRRSSPADAKFGRVLLLFSGSIDGAAEVQVVATLRALR